MTTPTTTNISIRKTTKEELLKWAHYGQSFDGIIRELLHIAQRIKEYTHFTDEDIERATAVAFHKPTDIPLDAQKKEK